MKMATEMAVENRILQLLQHLGIRKAHFMAGGQSDWLRLVGRYPELFATLTLVNPPPLDSSIVGSLASRLMVFRGDSPAWDDVGESVAALPGASLGILKEWQPWSDLISRHEPEIAEKLHPFLAANTPVDMVAMPPAADHGAVSEITYQVRGSGPPVVLLPLGFVPSQWEPLIPALTESYCTITLGGAQLGVIALLERRARVPGYVGMVRHLLQEAGLESGHSILEVGCGTGALLRWLAHDTDGANAISGVDISQQSRTFHRRLHLPA